jgi:biopolymer transport protein ExbB/TolQ
MPNLLPVLENGLFALGQVLRFPVFALLWVCVATALFMAGRTVIDFVMRRRERAGFNLDSWIASGVVLDAGEARRAKLPAALRQLLKDVETQRHEDTLNGGGLEHLVLEQEERVRRQLTAPRMLVRVGPSLGLIGTLIPMGVSLAAMSGGDLQAMSGQMVVAFTSTIIGLAAGTLAYVVATVRLAWVNEAVREQRYLAERISSELTREPRFAHKD